MTFGFDTILTVNSGLPRSIPNSEQPPSHTPIGFIPHRRHFQLNRPINDALSSFVRLPRRQAGVVSASPLIPPTSTFLPILQSCRHHTHFLDTTLRPSRSYSGSLAAFQPKPPRSAPFKTFLSAEVLPRIVGLFQCFACLPSAS